MSLEEALLEVPLWGVFLLTVVGFAMLVMLIADLSRHGQGLLQVRRLPFFDAQSRMVE